MSGTRLTPGWRLKATLAAVVLAPAVHLVHMERLTRWARCWAGHPTRRAATDRAVEPADLAEWVDRLLGWLPWPWRRTCLKRAITLYYLLASAGHPVVLRVGVRRSPAGALEAHAWLMDDGAPFLEPHADVGSFTTISHFA